jgi:DNA primase
MIKYLNYRNELEQHGVMDVKAIISMYDLYYCDSGRYAKRIIMPIRDHHGRYIYFTNRSIYHDSDQKNLFPTNTDATNFIYGLYESLGARRAFLVEGPFEVFQMRSYAIKHKIKNRGYCALMGNKISEERCVQLSMFFDEIDLVLDNEDDVWKRDKDGKNVEDKVYEMLSDYVKVNRMTKILHYGKEPATCTEDQLKRLFRYKPKKNILIPITNWHW